MHGVESQKSVAVSCLRTTSIYVRNHWKWPKTNMDEGRKTSLSGKVTKSFENKSHFL